jgi:phosphoglycolate phosphatase-like HAD superfamily hydrolase
MGPYEKRVEAYVKDVDAFVFDWDDTLIDTIPGKVAHNIAVAREFGVERTEDEVKQLWQTRNFIDMITALCGTDDIPAIMSIVRRDYHDPRYAKRPIETIDRDLAFLHRQSKKMGIVTSISRDIFAADFVHSGIKNKAIFDYVQTLEDTTQHKPDPRVFDPTTLWLNSAGIVVNQAVYVGDGLGDMEAAFGAGYKFIGIERGFISAEEFEENGVISLPGVHELVTIIRRIHGHI